MSPKEVLDKAYGSIPKETTPYLDWNFIPTYRGVKYYWLKLVRLFTR